MKRMLVLLMALSLCALPALAGQGPDVGPLSVEELNAFTERLLVRGLADQLPLAASEEGFVATGEGYTLYLESSDLSLDSVLSDASITLESAEKEDLEDQRGITVLTPLDVLYASYPDNNPGLYGTSENAALYLTGELPGAVAMGLITRDGQDVKLVEHSLWQPVEDGYMHSGMQYSIDRGLVVGVHYFGGSALRSISEAQEAFTAAQSLMRTRDYFAFDTVNPLPLQSEDLSFGELDFLDLTPERAAQVLGQASYDERMKDSNGEELRVMQWDGVEAAFTYSSSGEFLRAERIDVSLPGIEGPRGLRAGTELNQAIGRFEHGVEFATPTQLLYGNGETPPYGRMETQGSEAQLHYALDQEGEVIMLTLMFIDGVMVNMSISY